ncbi:MAG: hypothetical protein HZA52_18825 [Planctomycetes bacterium]|nr:hypothetical protein [Planctomycetota bacterium]
MIEEKLKTIEPGRLEELVSLYLSYKQPRPFALLVETGHNQLRRVVKDPVDGVAIYPSDPPEYGYLACTAQVIDDGDSWFNKIIKDLDKVSKRFAAARPPAGSRCIVAIGSCYSFSNRSALITRIEEAARSRGMQHVLVESSQLARFLDLDPSGQHWRRQYFGIEAELFSQELLMDICTRSIAAHRGRMKPPQSLLTRSLERELVRECSRPAGSLTLLVGDSGRGKSVLLNQVASQLLREGRPALWIDDETLTASLSLQDVVAKRLREFEPRLAQDCGLEALRSAATGGLVVVVDDLVRTPDPARQLERLIEWSGTLSPVSVRIATSCWPGMADQMKTKLRDVQRFQVDIFRDQERLEHERHVSHEEANRVRVAIAVVAGDPFLYGVLRERRSYLIDPTVRGAKVVRELAEDCHAAACERVLVSDGTQANADVQAFIESIVIETLSQRRAHPLLDGSFWSRCSFDRAKAGEIAEASRLGRIEMSGPCKWLWSHGRIRDLLLGRHLGKRPDVVTDGWKSLALRPELTEALAVAICYMRHDELTELLPHLKADAPLVLAELARASSFPEGDASREALAAALRDGLATACRRSAESWRVVADAMLRKLATAEDSELVLSSTANVCGWSANVTRTAAGDVSSAVALLQGETRRDFPPVARFDQRDAAVAALARRWWNRRNELGVLVSQELTKPELRCGALCLIGFLGWTECASTIANALKAAETSPDHFLFELWALSRCCDDRHATVLDAMLDRLGELDSAALECLIGAGRFSFSETAIHRWVGKMGGPAEWRLACVLRHQDHPAAAKAYVVCLAKHPQSMQMISESFPFDDSEHSQVRPAFREGRAGLYELLATSKDAEVRMTALKFLGHAPTAGDLPCLKSITPEDALWERAASTRASIGDPEIAGAVADRMRRESAWLQHAPRLLQHGDVRSALVAATPADEWAQLALGQALLKVPRAVLREWLKANADWAAGQDRVIPYLWRTGDPEALVVVCRYLFKADLGSVEHFFRAGGWPYPVSREMLTAVEPYLARFTQRELEALADTAFHGGYLDWVSGGRSHLATSRALEQHLPTPERIQVAFRECVQLSASGEPPTMGRDGYLLERVWAWPMVRAAISVLPDGNNPMHEALEAVRLVATRGAPGDLAWVRRFPGINLVPNDVLGEAEFLCWRRSYQE